MYKDQRDSQLMAVRMTKDASKQTYYTIRFLADRERVSDAYRAYAYFRWVDDVLDTPDGSMSEKIKFISRQKLLMETCYQGLDPREVCEEERMLVDLIHNDTEKNSGLQIYLRNMMDVMSFDNRRQGLFVSQPLLTEYSHNLAVAVTEALHFFIGHNKPAGRQEDRYLAVTAAHITHMLRDTYEDVQVRYFNIPREYIQAHGLDKQDLTSAATREWVCRRVELAHKYFKSGRNVLSADPCLRRRLAGFAYTARFEWVLRAIEQDNYCLRCEYSSRRSLAAGLWMTFKTLAAAFSASWIKPDLKQEGLKNVGMGDL